MTLLVLNNCAQYYKCVKLNIYIQMQLQIETEITTKALPKGITAYICKYAGA